MSTSERDLSSQRLVVFGATGVTGGYVLRRALDQGLHVRAAVRSPDKLPSDLADHERLEVMKVDVTDTAAVARAIAGVDMVFAALGYKGQPDRPVLLPFVREVVRSMRQHQARRFVYQASGLSSDPNHPHPAVIRYILRPLVGWVLGVRALWSEHDAVIRFLAEEAGDLDWTVTRPGMLSDGESRGVPIAHETRAGPLNYRDVAAFSLDAVTSGAYAGACPYLAYP
ncbi:MAG: NAD(P)H-binding protein [Myxococcota bacterium]